MSQTGYTPISLYYSTTAAAVPVNTNLANGELAINITDGKLYYKDNGGTVRLLASNATSAPVLSFQTSLSGLTPSTATTGVVTLAGTLGTSSGGTNLTSFTSGGAMYATSTSVLTTGTLPTTAGGTALTSFTSGGVVYASSTSALATGSALTFDGTNLLQATGASAAVFRVGSTVSSGRASTISLGNNAGTARGTISLDAGTELMTIGSEGNFPLVFQANGTEGMRLTSTSLYTASGINVGIGTSSPTARLQVSDVTNSITPLIVDSGSGADSTRGIALNVSAQNYGRILVPSGSGGAMAFWTGAAGAASERLRIGTSGQIGLSGANYGTSGQVLTSGGSGAAPTWTTVSGGGGSPGGSNTQVQYNSSGSFAGSANFTFNGTGITTGNVNVTSSTNPTAGMYYNSTATSGLSFYNTGASGGSSAMQIYYGRSTMSATTGGVSNPDSQWYAFGTNQTPSLTIGSTASLYYFTGHNYRLDEVPYVFRIRASGRGDNGSYTVPESNGILFIDLADDYGGNGSEGRNCIYVNNRATGFGLSTNGVKVINNFYGRQNAFYALLKISDPNGGGQNFGYYAQIDTSAGANDNAAPVGLVIDNALVNNYTKTNGGAQMAIFYDRRDGSTARTAIQFYRNTTSNSVGTITTTNTATAYNTSSDYRLKENIAPLTGAIEKVLRLKPSTYTWKVDGSAGEGFIAHELQEVIPQAVSGEKDAEKLQQVEVEHAVPEVQDADGNIISHGKAPVYEERMMPVYQGVDSSFLVATLTAAIQEQQALIVALTARVAALEAK